MKKTLYLLIIFASLSYYFYSVNSWRGADYFRVIFFDVGQGDSALIVTPSGQTILIDGGPDARVLKELGKVLPFWLRSLDLVVLTHAHDDHLAGLIQVLNRYHVKQILVGAYNNETPLTKAWQDRLVKSKSIVIQAEPRMLFNFSSNCVLEILTANQQASDENDLSVVSVFSCLGKTIYLSGDASSKIEKNIESKSVDIYKVSHHGSVTANSEEFLRMLNPKLVVISVGINNKFSHPSPMVINRLLTLPVNIFRTDEQGSLYFLANNKTIIWNK